MEVTCGEMSLKVKAVKNMLQGTSVLSEINVCYFYSYRFLHVKN